MAQQRIGRVVSRTRSPVILSTNNYPNSFLPNSNGLADRGDEKEEMECTVMN